MPRLWRADLASGKPNLSRSTSITVPLHCIQERLNVYYDGKDNKSQSRKVLEACLHVKEGLLCGKADSEPSHYPDLL